MGAPARGGAVDSRGMSTLGTSKWRGGAVQPPIRSISISNAFSANSAPSFVTVVSRGLAIEA